MKLSVANPARMREVLGEVAEGMSDEELIALHHATDDFADRILTAFRGGARAPKDFVPQLDHTIDVMPTSDQEPSDHA